ncbi:MAG TPA: hypothetical protein VIY52_15800 [Streptosporangiaceae bacterium]
MAARAAPGAGLVAMVSAVAVLAGCTSAAPRTAAGPAPVPTTPSASSAAPPTCRTGQIQSAVARFFAAWDHRDKPGLGSLFDSEGALDMATKYQDTLHDGAWDDAAGPAAIEAFAAAQWRLGEMLSYHGMTVYPPEYGASGGAEVDLVSARFADGDVQPIEEAKFNYDCAQSALTHVVIISAGVGKAP